MFQQNPLANDGEFVMLFQPVFVHRKNIQQMPSMAMPAAASPQPLPASTEHQALPPSYRKHDFPANDSGKRVGLATDKQVHFVEVLAAQNNIPLDVMLNEAGAKSLEELTNVQANQLISKYKIDKPSVGGKHKESKPSIW